MFKWLKIKLQAKCGYLTAHLATARLLGDLNDPLCIHLGIFMRLASRNRHGPYFFFRKAVFLGKSYY